MLLYPALAALVIQFVCIRVLKINQVVIVFINFFNLYKNVAYCVCLWHISSILFIQFNDLLLYSLVTSLLTQFCLLHRWEVWKIYQIIAVFIDDFISITNAAYCVLFNMIKAPR